MWIRGHGQSCYGLIDPVWHRSGALLCLNGCRYDGATRFSLKLALFALLSTTLVSADAVYAAQAQQARAERPKLGLVLSGGGARGFAHIGALKALEELRVRLT